MSFSKRYDAVRPMLAAYETFIKGPEPHAVLEDIYRSFFERHPSVFAIAWEQEPDCDCPHGVAYGEPLFSIEGVDDYAAPHNAAERVPVAGLPMALLRDAWAFADIMLGEGAHIFGSVYGSNVAVTVTRDGREIIAVEEHRSEGRWDAQEGH